MLKQGVTKFIQKFSVQNIIYQNVRSVLEQSISSNKNDSDFDNPSMIGDKLLIRSRRSATKKLDKLHRCFNANINIFRCKLSSFFIYTMEKKSANNGCTLGTFFNVFCWSLFVSKISRFLSCNNLVD